MKHIRDRKFTKERTFAADESNYPYPLSALANGADNVKVNKKVAQEWLMYQETTVYQGVVYWLQIKPIGLGLYGVRRRAKEHKETILVETFENK
jgi:hypothetical protein